MKNQLKEFYLDWINNFLTVERMAEHYGITAKQCESLITIGMELHETEHGDYYSHMESPHC